MTKNNWNFIVILLCYQFLIAAFSDKHTFIADGEGNSVMVSGGQISLTADGQTATYNDGILTAPQVVSNENYYAEMYIPFNGRVTQTIAQNTNTQITGFTAGEINGFTFASDGLTWNGTQTKKFRITYSIVLDVDTNGILTQTFLQKEGTNVEKSRARFTCSNGAVEDVISYTYIEELATDDTIDFYMRLNNAADVEIHMILTITEL